MTRTMRRWMLALLAVTGVPAGVLVLLAHTLQDPWLETASYAVGGILLGFIARRLVRLRPPWFKSIVAFVRRRLMERLCSIQRRYLEHLIQRHRDFEVKGLDAQKAYTLPLDRVFVELGVVQQFDHCTTLTPSRALSPDLRHGRHVVWEYLTDDGAPPPRLLVLGGPGSGKTTLLKHTALALAGRRQARRQADLPDVLPILLSLRNHAQAIAASERAAESASSPEIDTGALRKQLAALGETTRRDVAFDLGIDLDDLAGRHRWGQARELVAYCKQHQRLDELGRLAGAYAPDTNGETGRPLSLMTAVRTDLAAWDGPALPARWLERQLRRGHCLIMLDGLDEVIEPGVHSRVTVWVQRQMARYPRCGFLIASHPRSQRDHPLSGVTALETRPFATEQIRRYVHNWYRANAAMAVQRDDPGLETYARLRAQDLLNRIGSAPVLATLSVNPLLLTMIATVLRYRSALPNRRCDLYAEICQVRLDRREDALEVKDALSPAQKQHLLEPLAYALMYRERTDLSVEDAAQIIGDPLRLVDPQRTPATFLKHIQELSGLLLEREPGRYGFAHKTFQEYLAAVYIQREQLQDELLQHVGESWWHETLRFYAALVDATPVLRACLAQDRPPLSAIELALECESEALTLEVETRAQLQDVLFKSVEAEDDERRRVASEALLSRRLQRQMFRLDEHRQVDLRLISQAEYQLFLDQSQSCGVYHQPDHWPTSRFPKGQGRMPVAGVRYSDAEAFCAWLNGRGSGEWRYRLPKAGELGVSVPLADQDQGVGYWTAADLDEPRALDGVRLPPMEPNGLVRWLNADIGLIRERPTKPPPQADMDRLARALAVTGILGHTLALAHDPARRETLDRGFDRALFRARALTVILARARTGGLTRVSAFDRALDRALGLARALERDASLDPSGTPMQVDALLDALTGALALAGAPQRDPSLTAVDLSTASDLAQALAGARARSPALSLARDGDLAQPRELARARNGALARAKDLARALTREGSLERAPGVDRELARAFSRTLTHAGARAGTLDLDLALSRALDLDLDRVWTGDPALASSLGPAWPEARKLLRQYTRADALFLALAHYDQYTSRSRSLGSQLGLGRTISQGTVHRRSAEAYMDLYVALCILEERVQGTLPAVEGIRIVRERSAPESR